MDHRDRRHQPSLCGEIRRACPCAPTRSPCPISKACKVNQSLLGRMFGYGTVAHRRHRRRCRHHARHRRSGGFRARHPDRRANMWRSRVWSAERPLEPAKPLRQALAIGQRRRTVPSRGCRAPRAVEMHAAAVQFDKGLGQGQAQAGAFIAALQPVIDLAEGLPARCPRRRATCRCRCRPPSPQARRRCGLRFDPDGAAPRREFDRIGKQIEEDLAQLGGVASQRQIGFNAAYGEFQARLRPPVRAPWWRNPSGPRACPRP